VHRRPVRSGAGSFTRNHSISASQVDGWAEGVLCSREGGGWGCNQRVLVGACLPNCQSPRRNPSRVPHTLPIPRSFSSRIDLLIRFSRQPRQSSAIMDVRGTRSRGTENQDVHKENHPNLHSENQPGNAQAAKPHALKPPSPSARRSADPGAKKKLEEPEVSGRLSHGLFEERGLQPQLPPLLRASTERPAGARRRSQLLFLDRPCSLACVSFASRCVCSVRGRRTKR